MIPVSRPFVPEIKKFTKYVEKIFKSAYLTNNGPLVQELEERLKTYLNVKEFVIVANGTLALQMSYRLLKLKGEVITTPFSFIATTSSMVWEHLEPVYVDINEETFNIDEGLIEGKISDKTSAIVPVHVFGNACRVEKIGAIGKRYNLKTIYDAAHAFGVKYKEESLLDYGDISVLSFHATKVFHTVEGGGLVLNDATMAETAREMRNFGFNDSKKFETVGLNAKMNEFSAAMGLCVLEEIDRILEQRAEIAQGYFTALDGYLGFQKWEEKVTNNYGYFPVLFNDEAGLLRVLGALEKEGVFPKRYFYPSLNTISYSSSSGCEKSLDVSRRILCLPIYPDLLFEEQNEIIEVIKNNL